MNEKPTSSGPVPETPDYEQYLTYSRREIMNVVEDIIEHRALVTVYFNQGEEYFVTNLLQVNPDFEELVFDSASKEELNEHLLQSRRTTFVTFLDQIKIQFHALRIETTSFEGKAALRTRLPDSLLRLQRRNYYRIAAPRATPLVCTVPLPGGGAPAKVTVGDLSVGGLAILAGQALAEFKSGTVFHNCKIDLPGHGEITVSLELRNNQSGAGGDAKRLRFGCQFLNLSGPMLSLIQRYINQLERNRRALT